MGDRANRTPLPANALRIQIPAAALGPWLAEIENPDELRVTLRAVALLAERSNRGGIPPSVTLHDLTDDKFLTGSVARSSVTQGLVKALERGTLVAAIEQGEVRVFLNDSAGRGYFQRKNLPAMSPADLLGKTAEIDLVNDLTETQREVGRANIFALYEEHIGPFGHSMAEQLKAAEEDYPAAWIEYAFSVAAEHNVRSWSYINTILRRLVREGTPDGMVTVNEHGKFGSSSEAHRRAQLLEQYRRLFGQPSWESRE